jgi:hypothetical protein
VLTSAVGSHQGSENRISVGIRGLPQALVMIAVDIESDMREGFNV